MLETLFIHDVSQNAGDVDLVSSIFALLSLEKHTPSSVASNRLVKQAKKQVDTTLTTLGVHFEEYLDACPSHQRLLMVPAIALEVFDRIMGEVKYCDH
jgi:hypothetical protein